MAAKFYELTVLRNGRPVNGVGPILAELDFDDRQRETTLGLLKLHLFGAGKRLGLRDFEYVELSLQVRDTYEGRGTGQPFTTFALPAGGA